MRWFENHCFERSIFNGCMIMYVCMIVHVLWYGVLVYSVPKTYIITFIGQNDCHNFAYYDGMYTG